MRELILSPWDPCCSVCSPMDDSFSRSEREGFARKVLAPAILGKSCPVCLSLIEDRRAAVLRGCHHAYCLHCIRRWSSFKRRCPLCNSNYDSWFFRIHISSRKFLTERLPSLSTSASDAYHDEPRTRVSSRRWRDGRSRPLPWRRSFGRTGNVHPDTIAERALQWRVSIYRNRLQAVPPCPASRVEQNTLTGNATIERLKQRLEPWIQRELKAVLGDPDPSVIVHVTIALYISYIEKNSSMSPEVPSSSENVYAAQLKPFLHEWAEMFWHELRSFAESPFTIETYDAVVEYDQLE